MLFHNFGNPAFKQDIGISMGIDLDPFWANLFLHFFKSKYVKNLISLEIPRTYRYHGTGRFIDDLCAINEGNKFYKSFKNIYPQRTWTKSGA